MSIHQTHGVKAPVSSYPPLLPEPLPYLPDTPDYTRPASDGGTLGDTRFRQRVGEREWRKLPAALRRRFSKTLNPGDAICYTGQIVETQMTFAGWLLARAAKLIGAPLPLDRNNGGLPAVVSVTDDAVNGGQVWTRIYGRRGKVPQVISSTKEFAGPTGLEEQVGGPGFGVVMALKLETRWHKLLFISEQYDLTLFGKRLPLPRWLSPGKLTVGHEDLGGGWFSFTLTIDHRLFGRILHQKSLFQDPAPKETYHG